MIELLVPRESIEAIPTAELCLRLIEDEGVDVSRLRLYDEPFTPRRLQSVLRGRKSFFIDGDGILLRFGTAGNYNHSFVIVGGLREGRAATWITEITATTLLVSARLLDAEYERWQNAEDPLEYSAASRSLDGLPMKSNGLPHPLDQMIVDTSHNPGRRLLRDGYVEAIGHRMWLGPEFFRRVPGASREAVLSTGHVRVAEAPGGVVEVLAHDTPFVDETTADLQCCLRQLLFPTTAGVGGRD